MTLLMAVAGYAGIVAASSALTWIAHRLRVPAGAFIVLVGLVIGRSGLQLIDPEWLLPLLGAVSFHIALVLGALGVQLGRGLLRLPPWEVVRRSVPPLLLATFAWGVAMAVLPRLPADLSEIRSFRRFVLPLSFVLAAFPLLAVRDLRGRPPADVGHVFLAAIALVGAVISFAPPFLWSREIDLGYVWRGPVLVLGESGALGVLSAVLFLFVTRRLRAPAIVVGTAIFLIMAWFCPAALLWFPFAGLGFGIALGRAGERALPLPFAQRSFPYSELPFALIASLVFAPDLWIRALVGPTLLHAVFLCALVWIVRTRVPDGARLVTGPGFLFLGLALVVRLDGRMGPISLPAIDFALPAWVIVRTMVGTIERVERRRQSRPTTKMRSSEPPRRSPPSKSP